jgi:glycerol-3-phosphate dehydrogenase
MAGSMRASPASNQPMTEQLGCLCTSGHLAAWHPEKANGMKRDLSALTATVFDLVVVGGGIYGACMAWEAALRGLSVALVEQGDFASATSANSLKTIHGGLRYLQHADLKRMRESVRERAALMRIAPHLVHPLPCLIPTYGHGMKGREVLALGLLANDLLSLDQNRPRDPQKRLPRGRVISREECLQMLPGVDPQGVTGGALFYDAQAYNTERLVVTFLRSAAERGARLANYAAVVGLVREGTRVAGVEVEDRLDGGRFTVRARSVISTVGPWVNALARAFGLTSGPEHRFAKAINLVTRPLFGDYAVGISGKATYHDKDALISKGSRFLFVAPWRGLSMVGTAYYPYHGHPDQFVVTEEDIERFIDEIHETYPAARLRLDDVYFVQGGLVPSTGFDAATSSVQLTKHYQIIDHAGDGAPGLISVVGVKYTTARDIAEKVITALARRQGWRIRPSESAHTALYGGQIEQFDTFLQGAVSRRPHGLPEPAVRMLVRNYGSGYPAVLRHVEVNDAPAGGSQTQHTLWRAETLHAVRDEMACKLADVIFRRTELGSAGHPGNEALAQCAEVMGEELEWSRSRRQREIDEVIAIVRGSNGTHNDTPPLADPAIQPIGVETAKV